MMPATSQWFWQAWLFAVVFIYPIPHTIALRNLLLLVGFLALFATWRHTPRPQLPSLLKPAAWGMAAITAWLVLHSLTMAPAPTVALDNLRGDWFVPLLTAVLAAYGASQINPGMSLRCTIAGLFAHLVWMFGWQIWLLVTTGAVGDGSKGLVPFGERDYHSSLVGFLIALLLSERIAYQRGSLGGLFVSWTAWVVLGLVLLADAALRVRNGTLVSMLLLSLATLWVSRQRPRFLFALVSVALLAGVSLSLDARWSKLSGSLTSGWNSTSTYWLSGDQSLRPISGTGTEIDDSAYLRAAWARQALAAIAEHPLGLGFGRDGFGRAVELKYGFKGMVSSHSGWLDFALAAGIPGLALLLLTAGLAIRGGWRQFREHGDAAGLMFAFLVGGYLLRCLLDGHLSGWRLGLFAFICGVLIAAMKPAPRSA